ncbi:MAG: hypothetical protein E7213_04450 [Clostridium sp.]|nr:hypothetical protein [Clostridium sp.]
MAKEDNKVSCKIKNNSFETEPIIIEKSKVDEINSNIQKIKGAKFMDESKVIDKPGEYYIIIPDNYTDYEVDNVKRYEIDHVEDERIKITKSSEARENVCKIIIILESPHKYEYELHEDENGEKEFIGKEPACKRTGKLIEKNILSIIETIETHCEKRKSDKYDIYIGNPVKFQASLGSFYKGKLITKIKDELWVKLYKEHYKEEFANYIKNNNFDIVINCCSELNGKGKKQITEQLKEIKQHEEKVDFEIIQCAHPASWWNEKNNNLNFVEYKGKEKINWNEYSKKAD